MGNGEWGMMSQQLAHERFNELSGWVRCSPAEDGQGVRVSLNGQQVPRRLLCPVKAYAGAMTRALRSGCAQGRGSIDAHENPLSLRVAQTHSVAEYGGLVSRAYSRVAWRPCRSAGTAA